MGSCYARRLVRERVVIVICLQVTPPALFIPVAPQFIPAPPPFIPSPPLTYRQL